MLLTIMGNSKEPFDGSKSKKTRTRSFGVSKRENHDSSSFYNTKLYKTKKIAKKIPYVDNLKSISPEILDHILQKDSRDMSILPDSSVHLMITSPPYNVTKEYDEDLSLKEYLELLTAVLKETWRVLVPGGRVAINIANVGRKPYIPLHAYIINIMDAIGFHMRGEIIWNKGSSAGVSTAWGSFASASNPCLRDVHEYILIFSKLTNKLEKEDKSNSIEKQDFVEWSKSIWKFPAESAKKVGHPAPFPEELPRRLIEFYSFEGNLVLDPFVGSGTTAIVAYKTNRHFIGFDISPEYVALANSRLNELRDK
jgi:modification methylase